MNDGKKPAKLFSVGELCQCRLEIPQSRRRKNPHSHSPDAEKRSTHSRAPSLRAGQDAKRVSGTGVRHSGRE